MPAKKPANLTVAAAPSESDHPGKLYRLRYGQSLRLLLRVASARLSYLLLHPLLVCPPAGPFTPHAGLSTAVVAARGAAPVLPAQHHDAQPAVQPKDDDHNRLGRGGDHRDGSWRCRISNARL